MKSVLDAFCKALNALSALLLALMVVLVFGNVVLRYALNSGITVSEEVSRWLFVWLTFLGAVVAIHDNAHLGTDMLISRLGRRGRRVCLVSAQLAMLYVTWLLFSGSLTQARINWDVQAPVTGASMAIFYGSGVVFAVAAGVLLGYQLWRIASGQLGDDELVMVQESEDLAQVQALHIGEAADNKR
jgi:TRAP-type C4-dicarboxylate transport system permease small subunit